MRDITQSEKKAWNALVEQMKSISEMASRGKDIENDMVSLSKTIKKYRQIREKALSCEVSKT